MVEETRCQMFLHTPLGSKLLKGPLSSLYQCLCYHQLLLVNNVQFYVTANAP